jgi:probable rRNA maturation factor
VIQVDFSVADHLQTSWDEPRIAALVRSILLAEASGASVIGVHLVDDQSIRELNAAHRGIDAVTDVLSFPLSSHDDGEFVNPPGEPVNLGDVVVSYPKALEQAAEYGHSVERELAYLVAHGVLHILGYDHELDADRQLMRQREEEALQPLGYTR